MNDNEILKWQEAISSLPDKQFFNTMRLYLGEIKTPYNKQRLTQQLAAFIKREENLSSHPEIRQCRNSGAERTACCADRNLTYSARKLIQ